MTTLNNTITPEKQQEIEEVVIRFVGDSGDGMQLTGSQFSDTSAMIGNDIATFPNYPAEIRAPQGSLYGVSGFQVHIGSVEINNPGEKLDLLVAMNPAGLKTNLEDLKPGHVVIADTDAFSKKNLEKAKYAENPLEDDSLENYRVIKVSMSSLTKEALKEIKGLDNKSIARSKNMFALGMVYWMYSRTTTHTIDFLKRKFKDKPEVLEANIKVLKTGYNYANTLELIPTSYKISPAKMQPGTYRMLMGNTATAWGFLAASEKSGLGLFLGSYPITPASDILHELVKHDQFGVTSFQAEDEIASITAAIGAAYAGKLAITTTSGPGMALKTEALGLALMIELPMVVVNVQRGGPSTGLPTKTEQSDLLQAMYGRSGESPVIVIAASTPSDSFYYAYMACKLTLEFMTPVILLSDGYIANGSSPWKIKTIDDLPEINNHITSEKTEGWHAYQRDEKTLARTWVLPGTPEMQHRVGSLEKDSKSGNVSYTPQNHEFMTKLRAEKIKRVQEVIPNLKTEFAESGELLIVGWGGTYGVLQATIKELCEKEKIDKIGFVHFNYINPLPKNTEAILKRYKKVLVCELNNGQLVKILKSNYNDIEFLQYNKIQGLPFAKSELMKEFNKILKN